MVSFPPINPHSETQTHCYNQNPLQEMIDSLADGKFLDLNDTRKRFARLLSDNVITQSQFDWICRRVLNDDIFCAKGSPEEQAQIFTDVYLKRHTSRKAIFNGLRRALEEVQNLAPPAKKIDCPSCEKLTALFQKQTEQIFDLERRLAQVSAQIELQRQASEEKDLFLQSQALQGMNPGTTERVTSCWSGLE